MQRLNTILIDPGRLSREGLTSLLERHGFDVLEAVGKVADLSMSVSPAGSPDRAAPSLILADSGRAADTARADLARLRQAFPQAKIVVLTDSAAPAFLSACFSAPVDGLISKNVSSDVLIKSIDLVLTGERLFSADLVSHLLTDAAAPDQPALAASDDVTPLSEREVEIVQCLVGGWSNKVIANRLNVTEATVKVHLKSILRKIKVRNRTQAAIWALAQGIRSSDADSHGD